MRRALVLLTKTVVSILLVYLSFRWVEADSLSARLRLLAPEWIALAVALMIIQTALLALRWQRVAFACAATIGFAPALQISLIANFFNQVLPSTIGGDGARIWFLAHRGSGWAVAAYSVLLDRFAGVFVLAILVIVCLPWSLQLVQDPIARVALLVVAFGALTAPPTLLLIGTHLSGPFQRWAPARHWAAATNCAQNLLRSRRDSAAVIAYSALIHLLTVAAAWCCVVAVSGPVSFAQVLFLMPPVLLIAVIPISIAGWGVRETSMIAAFAYAGLAESDGLTLSILVGAAGFMVGILGGIVWIMSGFRMKELYATFAKFEAIPPN
ncbi:MAG TPA: lysylphosphatidylglycerol synthase transmembrane domain-containing protein [Pseudolabrys sp.]|nr:lysylphosphatidylglycerol synthase transmembrane domain-containing protein [Pseudolabrys sp.]